MQKIVILLIMLQASFLFAQKESNAISSKLKDGKIALTEKGVAYFTNISMRCVTIDSPHYNPTAKTDKEQAVYKNAKTDWPSFYGCYDWHSAVHNHWTLLKLLKTYPKSKLNPGIIARLEESFAADNIAKELKYVKLHELEKFEFPYGTSWLLKVAEELITWSDPKAEKWLLNLKPLVQHIVDSYKFYWPKLAEPIIDGNHNNFAFGLAFALDYAKTAQNDSLDAILTTTAKNFYGQLVNYNFDKEPIGFDFMSGGLQIADLMRRVYTQKEYENWLRKFAPNLTTQGGIQKILKVVRKEKHNGFESHWDGFQLHRIWCLNGIMESVSTQYLDAATKKLWIKQQEQMWKYAQEGLGVGNYDIDHFLSTYSVFALEGYK